MSGKTKNIFVFSRMQPNFMAQSGIKLLQMSGITKQKNLFLFWNSRMLSLLM